MSKSINTPLEGNLTDTLSTVDGDNTLSAPREQMNIVIAGHVDHGKSTIIGRMLADTDSLPEGKLEQVKAYCSKNSKPFEYAYLLDALKDEQSQGITIDSARVFFKTPKRYYIIIDAPGHIEFLKNMVSGASRAESALLVIDAHEGVRENSMRHGYMLSMLGIRQLTVLINKMDLVGYDHGVFTRIMEEYQSFLKNINIIPQSFIPVSGRMGDNIAMRSENMAWYDGETVVGVLDAFRKEPPAADKPFRLPVQDIYKFTSKGDDRRIIAGMVETGSLRQGDRIIFYPSGKRSVVKSIESFNTGNIESVDAGSAVGFTLMEQIYISRGEIAFREGEKRPHVSSRIRVSLFWMGHSPMVAKKTYHLKLGTVKVPVKLEKIIHLINAANLQFDGIKDKIERHDVAECILTCNKAISFDLSEEIANTGRFVIVDDYEIRGGGIVQEAIEDKHSWVREKVILRNYKWVKSKITYEQRAEKYNQKSTLILVTGPKNAGKKTIAKALEARLFMDGKVVYFLGIGNVLYGVDADIKRKNNGNQREEHIRRLSEVAHIMLDAGVILIVTAIELTQDDLEIIKTSVSPDKIETIWISDTITTDISYDLCITNPFDTEDAVDKIKTLLQEKGSIFRPW